MPWKYDEAYYTDYTRRTWNETVANYGRFMEILAPFGRDLLEALRPRPGENILDMGTGPGEPAMTIAPLVGPAGKVTGIDLAEKMIGAASAAALTRGIGNATFRVMDCAHLDFPEGTFDAAISRFGFQIFTDPEGAAREAFRVLRPGGRIAVSVWGLGPQVPMIDAIIGPMLEHAEPDETGYLPTPYETGGPGEMVKFLESAGFRAAKEYRAVHECSFTDEGDYLRTILGGTPIGHSLAEEHADVQAEVLRKTRENLRKWTRGGTISIPAECAIVSAHRG
jgi:SAM-dependent methyltransferase